MRNLEDDDIDQAIAAWSSHVENHLLDHDQPVFRSLKGGVSFSLCASCLKTKTELLFNHVLMDRHRNRSKLESRRPYR